MSLHMSVNLKSGFYSMENMLEIGVEKNCTQKAMAIEAIQSWMMSKESILFWGEKVRID